MTPLGARYLAGSNSIIATVIAVVVAPQTYEALTMLVAVLIFLPTIGSRTVSPFYK